MKLYTIGFTKTSAERFFKRLQRAGVKKVVDTRLHRESQLAGFAKQSDLPFFLSNLAKVEYGVTELLAPTADILDAYRKKRIKWDEYEKLYGELLSARHVRPSSRHTTSIIVAFCAARRHPSTVIGDLPPSTLRERGVQSRSSISKHGHPARNPDTPLKGR